MLCPILVALLLSQLQSAAIDQTKDELTKLIGNLDPYIIDRLISDLSTTSHRNELILATSILAGEGIRYTILNIWLHLEKFSFFFFSSFFAV